jgi:ketosteroid isomerase-like protein
MQMSITAEVVENHLRCFFEKDLEGVLSDYSNEVVLFLPDGTRRGPEEIRPFFRTFFAEFAKPGARFTMRHQFVEGEYAYILWSAETQDNVYEAATDTFVVRDGKIVAQSFCAKITAK